MTSKDVQSFLQSSHRGRIRSICLTSPKINHEHDILLLCLTELLEVLIEVVFVWMHDRGYAQSSLR